MQPLKPDTIVQYIGYAFSIMSLAGCLYVIFSYFLNKATRRNTFFFLIFNLAILDLFLQITSTSILLRDLDGVNDNDSVPTVCIVLGVFRTWANLASYYTNLLFACTIYSLLKIRKIGRVDPFEYGKKLLCIYAFSLLGATLPLSTNSIGFGTLYCGTRASNEPVHLFWQTVGYIIPFFISFFGILVLMSITIYRLKSLFSSELVKKAKYNRLLIIPAIFLLVNSGGVAHRTVELMGKIPPQEMIDYHYLIRQLQGMLHASIYGYSMITRSAQNSSSPQTCNESDRSSLNDSTTRLSLPLKGYSFYNKLQF